MNKFLLSPHHGGSSDLIEIKMCNVFTIQGKLAMPHCGHIYQWIVIMLTVFEEGHPRNYVRNNLIKSVVYDCKRRLLFKVSLYIYISHKENNSSPWWPWFSMKQK